MARADWCGPHIYAAAQTFRDNCLRRDDSLFTPGAEIWTLERVRALGERVGVEDVSSGSFISKLEGQLTGLPAEVIQLGAEFLYMLLLPEADTGAAKKREHIEAVLAMSQGDIGLPDALDAALDGGGVANFAAAKAYRDAHMRFLSRLTTAVKELSPHERDAVLTDPWRCRELVQALRTSTDGMQANAVLHLFFPDSFEYMISEGHRKKLIDTFGAVAGVAEATNTDEKIQIIRERAAQLAGAGFNLYANPFHGIWKEPATARWEEAIHWSQRLYKRDDFDENERTYKLEVAALIAAARDAMAADREEWPGKLRAAFTDRRNNLTSWRAHDTFLRWLEDDPAAGKRVLALLWGDEPDSNALRDFLDALPADAVAGPGTRLSIASFLLMGVDATRFPFFRATVDQALHKLLGLPSEPDADFDPETVYRPEELATRFGIEGRRVREFLRETYPREDTERGSEWYLTAEQAEAVYAAFASEIDTKAGESRYAEWSSLLLELALRMLAAGTQVRDLLDAQGVAWWLVQGPPKDWSAEDQAAFRAFRDGASAAPTPTDELQPTGAGGEHLLPAASAELAGRLHLPQSWLERLLSLLEEKRQIVLYGPPGTGKTFIAQHIGAHVKEHGGEFRLVQFHPSYTYEDFFEGYRPTHQEGGTLSFDLVPGTLRELAREAATHPDRPYLLIVDEINRGNIAKIFGELYFLLEYRDKEIQLQYSRDEQFRLPDNLFLIGTMNTADRSIALVDSALRRRFYFVGLIPTREPVNRVLAEWLSANKLDPEPAALLDALNEAIGDEDFSIGPSYFMTKGGTAPDLERIWRYSIMPLLEEHYYGSGRDLEDQFGIAAIRKSVAAKADAEVEPDTEEPAAIDNDA